MVDESRGGQEGVQEAVQEGVRRRSGGGQERVTRGFNGQGHKRPKRWLPTEEASEVSECESKASECESRVERGSRGDIPAT
eukprot:4552265-Pyramimonas_sp.AAC.2